MPSVEGFFAYDVRVGTVAAVEDFPEARKPAYKLWIDFGADLGRRQSSASLTGLYRREDLLGRQVVCVVNFPPRRIGPFVSEVLVLGVDTPGGVVLLQPERPVADGGRVY